MNDIPGVEELQPFCSITRPLKSPVEIDVSSLRLQIFSQVAIWHVLKDDPVFGGVAFHLKQAVVLSRKSLVD